MSAGAEKPDQSQPDDAAAPPQSARPPESLWYVFLPAAFVFFWATGFIGAKLGIPHAGAFTFMTIRFAIVAALLTLVALVMGAPWPKRKDLLTIAIGGVFVHAGYLGSVFLSIEAGVEAGVASMMAGLQPILTAAVVGPFLGEKVSGRQWAGLVVGFVGVALVMEVKLAQGLGTPLGMFFAFMAAVTLTFGTLWQKRFGGEMDLRTGSVVQFAASTIVCAPVAIFMEDFRHEWAPDFIIAMAWLVLVLSVGTITLLYIIIRRGAASKVSTLFFLVPPMTALLAYFMFGETLGPLAFFGMVLIAIGVAMVTLTPERK